MIEDFIGQQRAFLLQANARINIAEGAVRSGKTIASLVRWLGFLAERERGADLMMIGKTNDTLKRNVLVPLFDLVGTDAEYNPGKRELHLYGHTIHLVGANDERAEQKIRGETVAGAYGDEITIWPESFFTMLLSRMSPTGAKFFGTTNPDNPRHWLKRKYLDRRNELDLKTWHFTLADNPSLDPTYVENLKREYTGLWYKRYILGRWVVAEGAVYEFFDEAIHTIPKPPGPARHYIVGIDYGTINPTYFGLFGVNPDLRPRVWLEREYYYDSSESGKQKTDEEYTNDLRSFLGGIRPRRIYVDPSAASFKLQLKRARFPGVTDADNSVLDGIRTVARMLKNGEYAICRNCEQTIADYSAYVWDEKHAERTGEDRPIKQNDHSKDGERYALQTEFGKRTYDIGRLGR